MSQLLAFVLLIAVFQPNEIFGSDTKSKLYNGKPIGGITRKNGIVESIRSSTEYPFMAELEHHGLHWCGGAIISTTKIISAAHCFHKKDPEDFLVRVGHLYRNSEKAPGLQKRKVRKIISHPEYSKKVVGKNDEVSNDLAIVKLDKPLTITEFVKVIQLPEKSRHNGFANEAATILGWGTTESDSYSPILLKIDVNVFSAKKCAKEVTGYQESYLCTQGKNDKGAVCGGDSGGPVVKHYDNHPEKDILLGINSFAYERPHPFVKFKTICDEKSPSVAMEIAYYRKWIDSVN